MPVWIHVLQGLLTPAIAVAVGVIAFMQWRTAHQKVVLELFERRMAIYDEVGDAVSYAVSENGNLVSTNAAMRLYRCETQSLFLFGTQVCGRIAAIREAILLFGRFKADLGRNDLPAAELNDINAKCGNAFREINELSDEFTKAVMPFMRMHVKGVPTLGEWLY